MSPSQLLQLWSKVPSGLIWTVSCHSSCSLLATWHRAEEVIFLKHKSDDATRLPKALRYLSIMFKNESQSGLDAAFLSNLPRTHSPCCCLYSNLMVLSASLASSSWDHCTCCPDSLEYLSLRPLCGTSLSFRPQLQWLPSEGLPHAFAQAKRTFQPDPQVSLLECPVLPQGTQKYLHACLFCRVSLCLP